MSQDSSYSRPYWFVNVPLGQLKHYLQKNTWENFNNQHNNKVKEIKVGDKIAIKLTKNTRNATLPFDSKGQLVSLMEIRAIGVVTENSGDGIHIQVEWQPFKPYRQWFFYTNPKSLWCVYPNHWMPKALIDFTFYNQAQDIESFCNASFWRDRFGSLNSFNDKNSQWINFFSDVANSLLNYKNNRSALLDALRGLLDQNESLSKVQNKFLLENKDISPFSVLALLNSGTARKRQYLAHQLARILSITQPVPESFEQIPLLTPERAWLLEYDQARASDDMDNLWSFFEKAINFTSSQSKQEDFINAYNESMEIYATGWNLSIGLYWINSLFYPSFNIATRKYLKKNLNNNNHLYFNKPISGTTYLEYRDYLINYFQKDQAIFTSFPELTYRAWKNNEDNLENISLTNEHIANLPIDEVLSNISIYTIDSILEEGCFLEKTQLQKILQRLMEKKNIILQGAPGTGKTWLAKRLAFALIGSHSPEQLKALQFHPNLSYEDFVRGWRPNGEGKLILVDGPLLTIAKAAQQNPNDKYVLVIEEINRGNPAHLFGDLLTLLEADKRNLHEALELSYRHGSDEKIYLPPNLYLIGTMNLADRSLALMDIALRRRFAFIDLQPQFNQRWHEWLLSEHHFEASQIQSIAQAIQTLNQTLAQDNTLGTVFQIGHSYFTPRAGYTIENVQNWYEEVIETEILPLLQEYWFDAPEKIQQARKKLLGIF